MAWPLADQLDETVVWRFADPNSFSQEIAPIGCLIGPHDGYSAKTRCQLGEYMMRHLVVALVRSGRLSFPFELRRTITSETTPLFVLADDFTREQHIATQSITSFDALGWLGASQILANTNPLAAALGRSSPPVAASPHRMRCELAVYDPTPPGQDPDFSSVTQWLGRIAADRDLSPDAVHIVRDLSVLLDAFGASRQAREPVDLTGVYEIDYAGWIEDQIARLRAGDPNIDSVNLSEELFGLSASERHALRSQLKRLLVHLFKWRHQPDRRSGSWQGSIDDARDKIFETLSESPSLKSRLQELFEDAQPKAKRQAAIEMEMDKRALEHVARFELDQALDPDFLPDAADSDDTAS